MERDLITLACDHCDVVVFGRDTIEAWKGFDEHLSRLHSDKVYPNWLPLTVWDKKFLRRLKISVPAD